MRFASIDIGSNAVRLLLSQVLENGGPPVFKKDSLVRFPLRLGDDAFLTRRISNDKSIQLTRVMTAFRHLIDAYAPLSFRACATSALREAENRDDIVRSVRDASGIDLEIVDGRVEAEIIFANRSERIFDEGASFLYIDVGGGSTQLTVFARGSYRASRSFNIGAIRILNGLVPRSSWREMKTWISDQASDLDGLAAIGSGGNINKIFMLAGKKPGRPLSVKKLKKIDRFLARFDYNERVRLLGLRPDRADVILPALNIFLHALKWADIDLIYIPFIGLSDGLIHQLYDDYKNGRIAAAKLEV